MYSMPRPETVVLTGVFRIRQSQSLVDGLKRRAIVQVVRCTVCTILTKRKATILQSM